MPPRFRSLIHRFGARKKPAGGSRYLNKRPRRGSSLLDRGLLRNWVGLTVVAVLAFTLSVSAIQNRNQSNQQTGTRSAGVKPKRQTQSKPKGKPGLKTANASAAASDGLSPILATADFDLTGLAVTAGPASLTVPKNTPTFIQTSVNVPAGTDPAAIIAELNPNYRVRGELTGPSLTAPLALEAPIGQPLNIPGLSNAGDHLVRNLRVVDVGTTEQTVVTSVTPDFIGIVVIERLLISQVQVHELTYDQIIQAGINITDDSYKAFNFTLGIATSSEAQTITIPVAFPSVGVTDPRPLVGIPSITGPGMDVPTVAPVMLTVETPDGKPSGQPPMGGEGEMRIPGVIVFPGRVGFLHQFFEAIVIVANGAPNGAPLILHALKAKAHLPDNGTPADASDDPLRIAETQTGGRVDELELHGLGPDGKYGTADDTTTFAPADSGQASFLIEGLKEGLHPVNFDLEAMLEGLPGGPVKVRGEVSGAVLVRDASFAVTFTHPSVVRAGNQYDLGMTIYNSGQTDIQGAFAQLASNSISGAELIGQDTGLRPFDTTIRRGESATVKWRLRSNTTGEVTASYVKVGEGVSAGLRLVTGVGDRNIPLSPDSLILPDPVRHLPSGVVEAGRALLGQGWSIANAPPGSLPQGVLKVSKQTVVNRAVELGIAGMRVDFGEPVSVSLDTVLRDWLGELQSDAGFADAQRNTLSGYDWFDSIGAEFYKRLNGTGAVSAVNLHQEFANTELPRSRFISALVTQAPGDAIVGSRLVDSHGKQIGFGASEDDRAGDLQQGSSLRLLHTDVLTGAVTNGGQMLLVSNAAVDNWTLELSGWRTGMADLSLLAQTSSVNYGQFVWSAIPITEGGKYRVRFRPQSLATAPVLEEYVSGSWQAMNATASVTTLTQPAPRVVGVIQVTPEVVPGGDKYGRLVGVLFSKPMLQDLAQTVSRYKIGGGTLKGSNPAQQVGDPIGVTGARMDYGNRFVFISLNSTIGPYIERDLTINGLQDMRRVPLTPSPSITTIEPRVSPEGIPPGAWLTGRVLNGNGTPVYKAPVIVWVQECPNPAVLLPDPEPTPIALKFTDAQGRYQIDYVRNGDCGPMNVSVTNPTTHSEKRFNSAVAYDGQHMVLDMVFLARGNVEGNITSGSNVMPNAYVRVVPDLDVVGTKVVQADANGHYVATDIPVGNVSVLAVGAGDFHNASGFAAGTIDGPNRTAFINVSLQNIAGVVDGHVYRYDQTPSAGALVVAYAVIPGIHSLRGDGATAVGYAFADRDGSFRIANLPVGNVKLEVTDYVTGLITQNNVQLTTALPEAHGIIITLPGPGSVSGRVTDDLGVGLPNIYVSSAGRAVQTDSLGNYTLPSLPTGSHTVSAYDPILQRSGYVTGIVVQVGQTTTGADIVLLRLSSLNGTVSVINEGTTTAVPAAGVKVSANGFDIYDTDAQGHYSIPNVQPGQLTLRFFDVTKNNAINTRVVLAPGETLTRNATFRPGKIHGKVFQPDGVTPTIAQVNIYTPRAYPVPGPEWGVLSSENPLSTQSAADGSYSVSNLNPGAYRVTTSNVFFPTRVSSGGTLAPGADDEVNLTLVSTLAGKIQGRVFQPDGTTPVGQGILVTLGGGSLADATVRTDETGHYEFGEVFSAGTYTLIATDPSVGNTNRIVVSVQKNKDAVFNLRLLGAGSLRVRVIDGGGNPVNSGSVTLDGSAYPNAHRFAQITPESNGIIVFDNLPEGPYAIAASRLGLGGRAAINVPINATVESTILLQASGTVEGRVFMPGGTTPVGLADVQLTAAGRSIGYTVTSDTDPDKGTFRFLNVPAGDFTLDVLDNRTGRVGRSAGHIDSQDEIATVNVELLVVGAVAGRVTANGQPVDHALVEINSDGSGVRGAHLSATTDPDGRYRFTGIPAGRFQINVSDAPGGQTGSATGTISGTVEPLPDKIVDIALAPSQTVTGTIYKLGGTEPVPGAVVYVNGQRIATNDQGAYRLSFVPLGQVHVRAEAPSGNDRGEAPTVTGTVAGGTIIVNVTLAGTGNITGLATDNSGTPLTIGTVTFTNDAWGTRVEMIAPVRADGTYQFTGAFAGEFALRLTVPGNVSVGTAAGTVVAGQTTNLNIHLEDAGRLKGRVKSEDGAAFVAGADVNVTLWRQTGALFFYTHTNSDGEWSVNNVPLGSATVRVFDPATESAARSSAMTVSTNGQIVDFGEMRLRHNKWGVVEGIVQDANSAPVFGATVTITAANGTFTATTGANGQYHFEPIDVGNFAIQATDDSSGFFDRRSGQIVQDEQVVNLSLRVIPRGTITGVITRHDGTTVVAGAQVVVKQSTFFGSVAVGSATTDAQGHYTIELIPIGTLFLNVTEPATGDRGYLESFLGTNGETKNLDVSLRGQGSVVVTVTNPAGTRVENAQVTLTTPYPLETGASLTTQFDGTATFDTVLAGDFQISVHHSASGLNGSASGVLSPGTTANVTVQLEASGTISGRVLAPNGLTPVVGVTVKVNDGPRQVVTGPGGVYSFANLTLGTYNLSVFDTANHLRARASALQITTDGEVVTRDLVLEAVGTITGHVTFADGSAAVPNASVGLRIDNPTLGQGAFEGGVWADANGAFRFDNVIIGDFVLTATDPVTHLDGTASGSLSAGATVDVNLQLEDAGRISGRVLEPDGVTPVAFARVILDFSGTEMTTGADGYYHFDRLPFQYHNVAAYDAAGTFRAFSGWFELLRENPAPTVDLTLAGVGTITGRVLHDDDSPAAHVSVNLQPLDVPIYNGYSYAETDDAGYYHFDNAVIGTYRLVVNWNGYFGQTEVTLEQHGGSATAPDIQLLGNAINLPLTFYDANNFDWQILASGTTQRGPNFMYFGDANQNIGGFNLDIIAGGVPYFFYGSNVGSGEENNREIAVRQENLGGLNVTRKVYVPTDGYFVRHLELLRNPTANPITVSVRVQTNLRLCHFWWESGCGGAEVMSSSSGDNTLDITDAANPDRWVVLDDGQDADPYSNANMPASAYAFDGAGATERVGTASLVYAGSRKLTYAWDSVTVQPGATVGYLHFGVVQTSRAAAQASAERLSQLPPEALAGLSVQERAQIRNFAIPTDGVSTLPALPPLDGHVTGRVFSGDGITGIGGGQVQFTSNNPIFSRKRTVIAGANGSFNFASQFNNFGNSIAIPRGDFTLHTQHPQIYFQTVDATGSFPEGESSVTQNLVFPDSGNITGFVRRTNGSIINSGSVTVQNPQANLYTSVTINSSGIYSLKGFPAGEYTLTANVNHSQGGGLTGVTTATLVAGVSTNVDITIEPTGTITGTVHKADGTNAANIFIRLDNGQHSYFRTTSTNFNGQYTLTEVPLGSHQLVAVEPNTGTDNVVPVTVTQDQTTTANITLNGIGNVQVTVTYASGAVAANALVEIKHGSYPYFRWAGYTNAQGVITINSVVTGPFTVKATNPNNSHLTSEASGNLVTNGATEPITVALVGTGIVRGHVSLGDGSPAANAPIRLIWPNTSDYGYQLYAQTNANGDYIFPDVEVGRGFTLRAEHPSNDAIKQNVGGQILTSVGQTLVIDVNFPATATLRVTALRADDTPFAYSYIYLTKPENNSGGYDERYVGSTDGNGVLLVPGVPVGHFGLFVFDFDVYGIVGSASGTINASDVGQTIDITIREGIKGNVQGRVLFGGEPQPYINVEMRDVANGRGLGYTQTDELGAYRFDDVLAGREGFRIIARSPWDYSQTGEATGVFTTTGETVSLDVTLPGSRISGRVFYADGTTPVPWASVWASQLNANGDADVHYSSTEEDGSYTMMGVREGDFDLYAQVQGTPLTGKASGTVTAGSENITLNVTLPPSGKVRGTVRDAAGQPVAGTYVWMTQGESRSQFESFTDNAGVFQFDWVNLGNFYVQSRDPQTGGFGAAGGSISNNGETVTADITLPATTTISGRIFRADGTTPMAGASVYIENFSNGGGVGRYAGIVSADASGNYSTTNVPLGLIRVTAVNPDNSAQIGEAETMLSSTAAATINVTLGNVVNIDNRINLIGADNFRYQFYSDGDMDSGGTTDDRLLFAYNGAFILTFQDEYWRYYNRVEGSNYNTAALEDGGREYAFGYDNLFGLLLKRKLFVPTAGGFARYLEIIKNPTSQPITVQAGIDSWFGYEDTYNGNDTRFRTLVSPTQTSNTYAITEFNDACCHPLLGHVFAGPNSRWPLGEVKFWNIDNDESRSLYRWNVTVAPGQTIIFMHFTAQHEPTDLAGTQTQAAALVSLTDPHALDGMSEEEKAQVVNFQIGAASATTGKVTVQVNYDSGSPAAGVSVYLREAAHGDATREAGRTDAQGRLTINDVQAGAFTVRAYSPATASIFVDATGTIVGGDVVPVTLALPAVGAVTGRVTSPNQRPIAHAIVEVAGPDIPTLTTETDAIGNYAFANVPVGHPFTVKVTRPDDANVHSTSATQTFANPGQRLTLDFVMPMWTWVWGHVYGGDGETPVAFSNVEVLDAATGEPFVPAPYQANSEGLFVTGWLLVGQQGVRVRATRPFIGDYLAEVSATMPIDDIAIGGVNVTLPLPVVKGTVSRSDGSPAPFPSITLIQNDENGSEQRFYDYVPGADGRYVVLGLRAGAFSLEARDQEGTQTTVTGTIADIATAVQLNVTLPATATVSGTVFDAAGARVPFAEIALSSSGRTFDRYVTADDQGNYTVERVMVGSVFVQAQHPDTNVSALGFGSVVADASASINVNLPAAGALGGFVYRADGTTPVANANVKIENFAGAGGNGHFTLDVVTDGSGRYDATAVQVGTVRVTASDPADGAVAGTSAALVNATTAADANITLGNAFGFNGNTVNLDGADGFRYDIWNDGDLNVGGTADGRLTDAYWGSHYLTLDDNWYYWNRTAIAALEDSGREIVVGSDSWGGLFLTRKVFVPSGGGFARYLDILSNPTDRPLTYRIGLDGWTGFDTDTRVHTAPSENGNTYAVLFDNTAARPALAEAFAGAGAATPISSTKFSSNRQFSYHWNVTVQPGQTVILMHFAVQREPTDMVGARTQAEALVNLSDPHALEGMTQEERGQVINFQIPNQAGVRNEIRNNTTTRKSDVAQPRRDSSDPAVAASGRSAATKADGQASGVRSNRAGRQGFQKR